MRPRFSVTSMRPSGRKASPQGRTSRSLRTTYLGSTDVGSVARVSSDLLLPSLPQAARAHNDISKADRVNPVIVSRFMIGLTTQNNLFP